MLLYNATLIFSTVQLGIMNDSAELSALRKINDTGLALFVDVLVNTAILFRIGDHQ